MKQNFGKYISVMLVVLVCIVGVSITTAEEQSQEESAFLQQQVQFLEANPHLQEAQMEQIELENGLAGVYTLASEDSHAFSQTLFTPNGLTEQDAKLLDKQNEKLSARLARSVRRDAIKEIQEDESESQTRSKNDDCNEYYGGAHIEEPFEWQGQSHAAVISYHAERFVCHYDWVYSSGFSATRLYHDRVVDSIQTTNEVCFHGTWVTGVKVSKSPGATVSIDENCATTAGPTTNYSSQTTHFNDARAKSIIKIWGAEHTTTSTLQVRGDTWPSVVRSYNRVTDSR